MSAQYRSRFRFHPEIIAGLFAVALGVGNHGIVTSFKMSFSLRI